MFPEKVGSMELLKALISGSSVNDNKRIAQIFEVFLQKSRSGLSPSLNASLFPAELSQNGPIGSQKQRLDLLAGQLGLEGKFKPSDLSPFDPKNLKQGQIEQYQRNTPRSVPLLANQAARRHGVPEGLFRKMIWIESEFNSTAVSPRGAMGLGQLMPETAKELGLRIGPDKKEGSVWHPESNLDASARYMKWLHTQFEKKGVEEGEAWRFSAAAYNAGIGNISKAMQRVENANSKEWENVAQRLPEVTGRSSRETLNYITRLNIKA